MEPEKKSISGIPMSGILVAVALIIGLVVIPQQPYKPSRPKVPEKMESIPHEGEDVPARLWQDPFAAAKKHAHDKKTDFKDHSINSLAKQIVKKKQDKVVLLGVMVFGGPYAEDAESRTRNRYAVLSALGELKYAPEDSEHIGYVCSSTANAETDKLSDRKATRSNDNQIKETKLPELMPYEWYESEESQNKPILVLWLNDSSFSATPLRKFSNLTGEIEKVVIQKARALNEQKPKLEFKILGPAGSSNLKDIIKEKPLCEKQSKLLGNVQIFSWASTVDPEILLSDNACDQKHASSISRCIEDKCRYKNKKTLTFYRTIGSDKALTNLLVKELVLRIKGLQPQKQTDTVSVKKERAHIALISEWDTFYGRNLPEAFKRSAASEFGIKDHKTIDWIHQVSYMRGIDGQLIGEKKDITTASFSKSADKKETKTEIEDIEQPIGRSQFDYLRRLALQLKSLDVDIRNEKEGQGIQAIGILGSDVYDKSLILQAMYKLFPDVVFFTTDLDARLLHPGQLKWTRNLVIASNFGLRLNKHLQKNTPPFRDNYQTSLFLATKIALNIEKMSIEKDKWFDDPRIFEVGLSGAVGLRTEKEQLETIKQIHNISKLNNFSIHPPPTKLSDIWLYNKSVWDPVLFALLFLSILLLFYCRLWKKDWIDVAAGSQAHLLIPYYIVILLILMVFLSIYIIKPQLKGGEPFAFFEGISIWPSEFLRFIAGAISIYFLLTGSLKTRQTNRHLAKEYFKLQPEQADAEQAAAPMQHLKNQFKKIPPALGEVREEIRSYQKSFVKLFLKSKREQTNGKQVTISLSSDTPEEKTATLVWQEYMQYKAPLKRLVRIVLLSIFYYIMCYSIIMTFDRPFVPYRGNVSYQADLVTIRFFAVPFFIVLITWVVDSSMLSGWLIRRLAQTDLIWPPETADKISKQFNLDCSCINEWIGIKAIIDISETVGRFVYYPFIVILILWASRLRWFDKWSMPLGLLIVIMLALFYSLYSAVSLRRSAQEARQIILESLWEKQVKAIGDEKEDLGEQIKMMRDRVKSIQKGAFVPFFEQPLVRAFLLFIGGGGSLLALDFLPF